jgi:endonuclease YncB( thermonuclease family)
MIRTILFFALFCAAAAHAGGFSGPVVGIADGDTLTVLDGRTQVRVRLAGIDAPEKAQPFGTRARQSLAACAFGRVATVDVLDQDRYGRAVGRVLVGERDCGLQQVADGYARHFKRFAFRQPETDRAAYARAEEAARRARLGLWRDDQPTPPWEWRHP